MKRMKAIFLFLTVFLFVAVNVAHSQQKELTVNDIKNAAYHLGDINIKLSNGQYEGKDPEYPEFTLSVTAYNISFGDLNNDGKKDAVVLLTLEGSARGNNSYFYLAAVINLNGKPVNVATEYVGEHGTSVESLKIESGIIVVNMLTAGPDDPLCCPTWKKQVKYRLEGDTLVKK